MIDPRRIEVIDDGTAEIMRGMTGAERLKIASDMHASARRMLSAYLRSQHPDWSAEELERQIRRRLFGAA